MKNENVRCLHQRTPLLGLFDRDSFILPSVDRELTDFLRQIIPILKGTSAVCLVAFYRHPAFYVSAGAPEDIVPIFYRWAVWNKQYPINEATRSKFSSYPNENCAISSGDFIFGQQKSLAAEFLAKIKQHLRSAPLSSITSIELEMTAGGSKSIEKQSDEIWFIKNPEELANFNSTSDHLICWTVYRLLRIADTVGGLVMLDGTGEDYDEISDISKREPLAATFNLLETSLDAMYQTYYAQLEYDTPKIGDELARDIEFSWDVNGLVYSSVFRKRLLSEVLEAPDAEGNRSPLSVEFEPGYLLAYFDGNGIKELNDSVSHRIGNEIIRAMGRWLHVAFWFPKELYLDDKPEPQMTPYSWVIRIAGDEFLVIIAVPKGIDNEGIESLKCRMSDGLYDYLCTKGNPREDLRKHLVKLLPVLAPAKRGDNLNRILETSLSGGWYDNLGGHEKYEQAWTEAEDTMYEAKHIVKSPQLRNYRSDIGAICLAHHLRDDRRKQMLNELPSTLQSLLKEAFGMREDRTKGEEDASVARQGPAK